MAVWFKRIVAMSLGAIGGYAYYYFIGCMSASCPITSNPWTSTAYGTLIGALLAPWRTKRKADYEKKETKL